MKKTVLFIFSFLFFTSLVFGQNLMTNGDLEIWTDPTTPTSWDKAENITQESVTIHGGTYSAKQQAGTKDLMQNVSSIVGGQTYTIKYYYLDNDANARSRIWSYWTVGASTLADNAAELRPGTYSSDNSNWQEYSQTLVAPATADGFRFEVRSYNTNAGSGYIFYDDFSVEATSSPVISNVVNTPSNPNSSQTVSVSADVTDTDGISSVELHWGTSSGSLGTTISMSNGGSGDTYTTSPDIPAQSDGTTVYYEIYAVDNNTNPTTSSEFSYFVSDAVGPTAGVVFISEVSDEDAGGYTTAYMEIYNNSAFVINMENSYIERWSGGVYDNYSYTFGSGVLIPANGILIISRGADQSTFETAWGISISSLNASFDQGNTNLYFTTGRSYKLFSPSARAELDTTPVVDSGNRIVQTSIGTWGSQESSSNATPGALDSGQVLPVTLTEFSAAIIMNEFVQISWTTQSESSINVWNLYRETDDSAGQILINSQPGTNTSQPFTYIFEDHEVEEDVTYYYYLEVTEYDGSSNMWGPISAMLEGSVIQELPTTSMLQINYPNPFNPSTTIKCDIKEGEEGEFTIFNSRGQVIERQLLNAGEHIIEWDGTSYGSGVYLYKLESESYTKTRKMIMIK